MPFVIVDATTGGTGTLTVTTATANSGPWSADLGDNWSGGSVPVSTDRVILRDSKTPILFGLAQSGITLDQLWVYDTFQAPIGLRRGEFLTGISGTSLTYDDTVVEYRETEWDIGWDDGYIGARTGNVASNPAHHWHFKQAKTSGGSLTRIYSVPTNAASGRPAMTLHAADTAADVVAEGGDRASWDRPSRSGRRCAIR